MPHRCKDTRAAGRGIRRFTRGGGWPIIHTQLLPLVTDRRLRPKDEGSRRQINDVHQLPPTLINISALLHYLNALYSTRTRYTSSHLSQDTNRCAIPSYWSSSAGWRDTPSSYLRADLHSTPEQRLIWHGRKPPYSIILGSLIDGSLYNSARTTCNHQAATT